jgi:FMN phosphatase YigB (HAD superfamily)
MIKKVAFDIGNVICHVDLEKFNNFLVDKKLFINKEAASNFIEGIQIGMDLGMYGIKQSFNNFFPNISKEDLDQIYYVWMNIISISNEISDFIKELSGNGWEIALLSNIGFDHSFYFNEIFNFEYIKHFSYEIGARKPSKLFYQSFFIENYWTKDVLFFDDRQENVNASTKYFNGTLFNLNNYSSDKDAVLFLKSKLELLY